MTQYLSDKIKVMSFLCIILVLYIHSGFHDYSHEIHGMAFNFELQRAVSGMIARCAVPMFFVISGYLFFLHLEAWQDLWRKMRSRVRTLAVPYLIACLFPACFYLAMEYVPGCKAFVNGGGFSENFSLPVNELLYMLYWDCGNGSPYAFHLWFLRDLIVIIAVSPMLVWAKKRIGIVATCLILLVANYLGLPHNPFYGMFWFVFGAYALDKMEKLPPEISLHYYICNTMYTGNGGRWDVVEIS